MGRSRKQRNRSSAPGCIFWLLLVCVFFGLAAAFAGKNLFSSLIPSRESRDLNEWLEVSGNEVRIFLDGEAEHEITAVAEGGQVYLPLSYVHEHLNERFFWSAQDKMVSYTLPDETVDITESGTIDGAPAFISYGDSIALSLDLVEQYTSLSDERFCGDDTAAKHVQLFRGGCELLSAGVKKNTKLRTKESVSAPVLETLEKGENVYVTDRNDSWSRVISPDGIIGYASTSALEKPAEYIVPETYREPEVVHTLMDEPVVLGWHGVYNREGNAALGDLISSAGDAVNVVSPTWIQISSEDGSYKNYTDPEYLEKAHEAGWKVWACVDNFNQEEGFKDFSTKDYFASAAKRRDFIARLMADAAEYGYDGLNLDFEGLPSDAGESYAQFFRELSVECRRAGIVLSIDNYVPYSFVDFYRIDEQGVFADYVVIMLYNETTDKAGPNASVPFTEFGIEESLKEVPAEQLIAALPLYTRVWTEKDGSASSETLPFNKAAKYVEEEGFRLAKDSVTGLNYGELTAEDGSVRKLWMEDADSLRAKMKLVKDSGLGGAAVWRLGYDNEKAWEEIRFPAK